MRRLFSSIVILLISLMAIRGVAFAAETPAPSSSPSANSLVYVANDDDAISGFHANREVVRRMVDQLVMAVSGKHDVASAWRSLVKPDDKVGIKVSVTGGPLFSTHPAVVDAIARGLELAGVAPQNIVIWARDASALRAAGFDGKRWHVESIEPGAKYDAKTVFTSPLAGRLIWGDLLFDPHLRTNQSGGQISNASHWSNVICHEVTKIINVPVLAASEECGITGCLYNVTVPNLDNWRRFMQGDEIADIYSNPKIGPKVVLNVMDALTAQYAGGPQFQPDYAVRFHRIFASKDPVALDAAALRLIDKWRKKVKLPSLASRATYLLDAAAAGDGNFAPEKINLKAVR